MDKGIYGNIEGMAICSGVRRNERYIVLLTGMEHLNELTRLQSVIQDKFPEAVHFVVRFCPNWEALVLEWEI